jgi:uncharacterized coiled-coil DUF342 family protein
MSTEQLIMALKSENSMLKKELKVAQAGSNDSEKVKELQEEIKKLKAELDEKTKTISALDVQLAEKKSNKNKATEKKED